MNPDSLLSSHLILLQNPSYQIIEAWLGLSNGGRPAQQAFYVYDELSQNPAHAGTKNVVSTITGKAAALAALGKYEEAKKTLEEGRSLVSFRLEESKSYEAFQILKDFHFR